MLNKIFPVLLVIIVCCPSPANAAKLAALPDVLTPNMIAVDGDTLYITDQYSLSIYSLRTFQLIKKIGRKGNGPNEYMFTPYIQVLKDGIILYTGFKFSLIKTNGDYRPMIEKKIPGTYYKRSPLRWPDRDISRLAGQNIRGGRK